MIFFLHVLFINVRYILTFLMVTTLSLRLSLSFEYIYIHIHTYIYIYHTHTYIFSYMHTACIYTICIICSLCIRYMNITYIYHKVLISMAVWCKALPLRLMTVHHEGLLHVVCRTLRELVPGEQAKMGRGFNWWAFSRMSGDLHQDILRMRGPKFVT